MATGDDALAAGMALVNGAALANTLDDEDNKTRDYIARFFNRVWGGVKGTTAPTPAQVRSNLGLGSAATLDADTSPTGGAVARRWSNGSLTGPMPSTNGEYAPKLYVDQAVAGVGIDTSGLVKKTGDTMTGNLGLDGAHLIVPAAAPATVSYAVAYINGDGRLSRGASSERYKKYISAIDPASLGDIFPDLHRFQMRTGDGSWKYGWIAERLAESDDLQPFVVYAEHDGELVPDSIDFIALLIAQNAQLHQAVDLLAQRLDALEATDER